MSDTYSGPPEPAATPAPALTAKPQQRAKPKKVSPTSKEAAEQRLAQVMLEQRIFEDEVKKATEFDDWYVECKSCKQPAIFLTEKPAGEHIGADQWYSTYRDGDGVWMSNKIMCQNCRHDVKALVGNDYSLTVNKRQIVSLKDRAKKQKAADLLRARHVAMNAVITVNEKSL